MLKASNLIGSFRNSVCHTKSSGFNWWRLKFQHSYYIHKVKLYTRSGSGYDLRYFEYKLQVSGYQENLDPTEVTAETMVFRNVDRTSQSIELQLDGKHVMLAEVKVFGAQKSNEGLSTINCWRHCDMSSETLSSAIQLTTLVFRHDTNLYRSNRVRNFRGRVSNFNKSKARKQCFLASDWLKFETLPRKFRTL